MFRFTMRSLGALMLSAAAGAATVYASNPVAVYARVDRVALAPNAQAPDTIQVWGVFSLATPNNGNDYQPPAAGYLYFKLSSDPALARREWADLKEVAGTRQIVAFGSRYQLKPRVRKTEEPPASPDEYTTGLGLTKVNGNTDYAPIRALVDYRK